MKRALLFCLVIFFLAGTARGEVSLVGGRLSADALIWANCCWQQTEVIGLTDSRFDFYRRAAFIGLTGHISSVTSMRLYFDVGSVSAYDLYVDFHWPSGFGLRVGQFTPPLSFEAWTEHKKLKLVEYSLVKRHWKPYGPRDIGLMISHDGRVLGIAGALVNGNGRNQGGDNNEWKDVCTRVVFKSLADYGLRFACRGYYGWVDEAGVRFWNSAVEYLWDRQPFQVLAEFQHAVQGIAVWNSFHIQAAYQLFELLEPVARFQIEVVTKDEYDFGLTGGLNFLVFGDRLKVMLNYNDWRRESNTPENRVHEQAIFLQLQGII